MALIDRGPCKGMEGTQKVWVTDQTHGFILGNITDLTSEGVTVQPVARGSKPVAVDYERVYPAEEDDSKMWTTTVPLCTSMKLRFSTTLNYDIAETKFM
ncbi:unconventional myosin-VI-like isoform X2 [Macrobrachium nipponense]|uniref:unconventional myosin-VI-like isoform X2 n=1 Tax=Macrobrachium nipponense TaxID=159736 RepID=UPI0030C86797